MTLFHIVRPPRLRFIMCIVFVCVSAPDVCHWLFRVHIRSQMSLRAEYGAVKFVFGFFSSLQAGYREMRNGIGALFHFPNRGAAGAFSSSGPEMLRANVMIPCSGLHLPPRRIRSLGFVRVNLFVSFGVCVRVCSSLGSSVLRLSNKVGST